MLKPETIELSILIAQIISVFNRFFLNQSTSRHKSQVMVKTVFTFVIRGGCHGYRRLITTENGEKEEKKSI